MPLLYITFLFTTVLLYISKYCKLILQLFSITQILCRTLFQYLLKQNTLFVSLFVNNYCATKNLEIELQRQMEFEIYYKQQWNLTINTKTLTYTKVVRILTTPLLFRRKILLMKNFGICIYFNCFL